MTADPPFREAPSHRVQTGRARALLLDPSQCELAERVVRLASLALRAPVAMLGVPEFGRLQVTHAVGLPQPWQQLGYLPLDAAFCRRVQQSGEPLAVEDAARDPSVFALPRLENFPRVSYCGVPLKVAGRVVAVLSVTDVEPRRWAAADVAALEDLAASVLRDIEVVTERLDRMDLMQSGISLVHLPDALLAVDAQWRFTFVSDRAVELLGRPADELKGLSLWELFPGLAGSGLQHELQRAAASGSPVEREHHFPTLSRRLEVRSYPLTAGGMAIQLRDVTEQRHKTEQEPSRESSPEPSQRPNLQRPQEGELRYRRLFDESPIPCFVMRLDGRLAEVNHAFRDLLHRPDEDLSGLTLASLGAAPEDAERLLAQLAEAGAAAGYELTLRSGDGVQLACEVTATAHTMDGESIYNGTVRDVTMQRHTEAELVRSALQDPLTGLPNRLVFMDRLERLLKQAQRRPGYRFAVVFLDLDNFKHVNDTHGHLFGDQLLCGVSRRLEASLRQGDTVARIGGDEFALILDSVTDVASVTWVVDRLREELAEPFSLDGRATGTTASIGVAISSGGYEKAEDLLRDADDAMYRAKAAGRNMYFLFDAGMHARAQEQRKLEQDLRQAMTQKQLAVHYHPVVDLSGGAVAGLEALVRWAHPERGILLPAEFMPMAERTGLIIEIGWWVLRESCRQLANWKRDYPDAAFRLTMSVNLSARQFVHPQLIEKIDEILQETGLPPESLRLDLTEAVVMKNAALATTLLEALRSRGIQICIDDFGTGFSSIPQLREFPISMLKIDRSFIRQLGQGTEGREIVQSIIALGESMSIDAVAEGVETPEQLEQLRQLGARFAQGFLFSLPLDKRATERLLENA